MGITATCANGHVLRVKDEFAGKSGLCPHCRARVFVPMPIHARDKAQISDDEILGLLGRPPRAIRSGTLQQEESDSVLDGNGNGRAASETSKDTSISLLAASAVRKTKTCPKCQRAASTAFAHCPRCGTPLPEKGDAASQTSLPPVSK